MITKEELIDIMKDGWQPSGYYSVNFNANMVADKILKRIRKELEVLEIIKHIVKIADYSDRTIQGGNLVILVGGEIKTFEEYQKIKEWLKEK